MAYKGRGAQPARRQEGLATVRHQYIIDPEIQSLLPTLSDDQRSGLRGLLVVGKHCDDLVVLHIESENVNVLGDGHNREAICNEEDIPFKTRLVKVHDRPAALVWVVRNQLGRRNLTDEQRDYYMGKQYLNTKQPHGGQTPKGVAEVATPSRTVEKIAEEHGVSPKTVQANAAFATAVDALPLAEKEAVLNGTSGKTKAEVIENGKPAKGGKNKPPPADPAEEAAPTDELDASVPPGLQSVFKRAAEFQEIVNQLNAINRKLKELSESPAGQCMRLQQAQIDLRNLKETVRFDKPYCVCPVCEGIAKTRKANCPCKQRGWLNETSYKNLPGEYRK